MSRDTSEYGCDLVKYSIIAQIHVIYVGPGTSHIIPGGIISGGSGTGLSMSPYQHELARLRMERLRIEEAHILEVKRKEELERIRGPQPKWLVSPFILSPFLLVTSRKRSCGKIMFSQVSVILSGGGGVVGG